MAHNNSSDQIKKIGKVIDAHGIRGDLYVGVFSEDISWLENIKKLTLNLDETSTQYEITMKKPHKKGFICHLKGINDRNQSELLKGADVVVDAETFVSKNGEQPYLSEILNFSVYDKNKKIGQVTAFSSNGAQDLLIVQDFESNKTYEIPFVKDFVTEMNFVEKKVMMNLPEGLLTLNEDD